MVHGKPTTAGGGGAWTVGGAAASLKARSDTLTCAVFKDIMSISPLLQIFPSVIILCLQHFSLKDVLTSLMYTDQNSYNTMCVLFYCIALKHLH